MKKKKLVLQRRQITELAPDHLSRAAGGSARCFDDGGTVRNCDPTGGGSANPGCSMGCF
jgi:hypothetical protein